MDVYALGYEEFGRLKPWPFRKVLGLEELNRLVAGEVVGRLQEAERAGRNLMVICPVGPLDYAYWAEAMNRSSVDGSRLVTVNMDEYLDDQGGLIDEAHPLSFRGFMQRTLFSRLEGRAQVPEANRIFPDPAFPEMTTRLIEDHGGADLCYGGMGLTGHFAFNDPPEPGEPVDDVAIRGSRTRVVTICRESQAQMCMGGTDGNWEILPRRAVTLGMYELLLSRRIHLTFMRSWHAGVLRRALFGPVTGRFPGSFIQEHPEVSVTLTELAAQRPVLQVRQRTAQ